MAHQARAMGRASTPRLSVFGHAFRRGVPYDAAKAAQIGSQQLGPPRAAGCGILAEPRWLVRPSA
eukprot:SAG25_NODE_11073_length_314_cov_0.841860_1_plen_64_part_10